MADVARLAGVSTMTVSRALRRGTSASEETRQRIHAAAEQLGYVLDSTASGLSSRKTGFVAVTIPAINNANFANTVRGLTEGLRAHELEVLLGSTAYSPEEEELLVKTLLRRRPEAIVVTGGVHTENCRRYLYASGVPVIETWDLPNSPIEHVVGFSNRRAGRMMARHLYERGYRKLGFIGGESERDMRGAERRHGFQEMLEELDLSTERLWDASQPSLTMEGGAKAMHGLLDAYPDTEAVMCASDLSAFGAIMTSYRRGLQVPEDIAVAGFGAYDVAAQMVPQITTLDIGAFEIGRQAAAVIGQALAEPQLAAQKIIIPIELLARQSTGC